MHSLKSIRKLDFTKLLAYIVQISSIICIQRFNTFYSVALILWVFITGFTLNKKILKMASFILAIPAITAIYVTLLWANIESKLIITRKEFHRRVYFFFPT